MFYMIAIYIYIYIYSNVYIFFNEYEVCLMVGIHGLSVHVLNENQKLSPAVFYKKTVLKNFAVFTGKHLCWILFSIKVENVQVCNFVRSYKYCEIFKNTYFEKHLRTAASAEPAVDFKSSLNLCSKQRSFVTFGKIINYVTLSAYHILLLQVILLTRK